MIINPKDFHPRKLNALELFLTSSVIGQEEAVGSIIKAMNIASAKLNDFKKPLAVLFFAGPTGVGKTETTKTLAEFFCEQWELKKKTKKDDNHCLVRVDCGNWGGTMGHGVINLLGAPASYVGYGQDPILTPSAFPLDRITVLLFDEIEKGFSSEEGGQNFLGILMRILDEARVINNRGEIVDFTKTIVIFTSNLGSREIVSNIHERKIGFRQPTPVKQHSEEEMQLLNREIDKVVKKKYEEIFVPEFRARIPWLIAFRFLTETDFQKILEKILIEFHQLVLKRNKIPLSFSKNLKQWILEHTKRESGVRGMFNLIEKIKDGLARVLNSESNPIQDCLKAEKVPHLLVDIKDDEIIFKLSNKKTTKE